MSPASDQRHANYFPSCLGHRLISGESDVSNGRECAAHCSQVAAARSQNGPVGSSGNITPQSWFYLRVTLGLCSLSVSPPSSVAGKHRLSPREGQVEKSLMRDWQELTAVLCGTARPC